MCEDYTKTHLPCYEQALKTVLGQTTQFESNYSTFFCGSASVAKLRLQQSRVVGRMDASNLIALAYLEFNHGKLFEPDYYIGVMPTACFIDGGFCNAAVIMRRLDYSSRLDRYVQSRSVVSGRLIERLESKLFSILNVGSVVADANILSNIETGLIRLSSLLEGEITTENVCNMRARIARLREQFRRHDILWRRRSDDGRVRILHGDMSWTNCYFTNCGIVCLDPCVAAGDMYKLDTAYQVADLGVECVRYGLGSFVKGLFSNYKKRFKDDLPFSAFRLLLQRHALIRACVHYVTRDTSCSEYLTVCETYDVDH